ncbi:MAG: hypothetical protein DRI57_32705 [Deltaproteobacteria bacterium]|nr:MAG: hypothetical protein DRI57_32705 [Deltaproteobacteria bacterium]
MLFQPDTKCAKKYFSGCFSLIRKWQNNILHLLPGNFTKHRYYGIKVACGHSFPDFMTIVRTVFVKSPPDRCFRNRTTRIFRNRGYPVLQGMSALPSRHHKKLSEILL